MLILSRRTIAVLAAFFGLLGVLSFAGQGRAATDNNNVLQALRSGGIVIVVRHGATFPDQADTDPLNFDNIAAQRNLNEKGKALAKAFGDAISQAGVPIGKVYTSKYNRAYETAIIAGFKVSRRPQILPRAVSWCRRTRITAASRLFASCSPPHRRLAPTQFSLRISRTSSMLSARTGSTSKRARLQSSARRMGATRSSAECRWRNGLVSRRRNDEGRHGLRVSARQY